MSTEALHSPEGQTLSEKLQLLKSPVLTQRTDSLPLTNGGQGAPDLSMFGDRFASDNPEFQKHEDASLLELFFDLLFAANYTVFSQTQGVNSHDRFKAYVGYFSILWMTWLVVSLYDVRFVTDSIFERIARAVHLGVMIGFAVVSPNFKPAEQKLQTMRTMSIILCVSRFCLTVEYASILWHIRQYKKPRLAMLLQIGINFVASMVYLGITFRFQHGNSSVYIAWYIIAAVEVVLTFILAAIFPVLSFTGTHLMKRMSTMTVLFLGDGVVIVAQNVVTIVKSPDAWDSQTIGIVTAAAATIYFVFLVYFDWMKTSYLPTFRQQAWAIVHFPFHLAMVLFMQGFTQFIIWSKIVDTINHLSFDSVFSSTEDLAKSTTVDVVNSLVDIVNKFFKDYPPKYSATWSNVEYAVGNISLISDDFWPALAEYSNTGDDSDVNATDYNNFNTYFGDLATSMENSLLETFGIDLVEEVTDDNKTISDTGLESTVNARMWQRFELVFEYGYVAAGVTLILMVLLIVIAQTKPWRLWSIVRTSLFFGLGLALAFVSLLSLNPARAENYKESPMLLPTICLVWFIVLLLTHIRNAPPLFFKRNQTFFNKAPKYDSVNRAEGEGNKANNAQGSQSYT
ncbi:hypothetical protein B0T10DRAFT_398044 [Thelonectria olida]|uniref:Low temperature requirement A n=1 Tax=Thelonectria olida TaxID=1576542 RepID=A0A9P8WBY1_9HYPO|nr:hypothetical protein B0T10DRAFT_398044 [Thelonectria olida]